MRLRPFLRRFRADFFIVARYVAATGIITGLVAGAAWGVYAEAWPAMVAHSYFRLRAVKVVCDSPAERPSDLAARAGLYDGTSLWEIDPGQARNALASLPWVRTRASFVALFPDEVSVEVFRRDPVALTVSARRPISSTAKACVYRGGKRSPDFGSSVPDRLGGCSDAARSCCAAARRDAARRRHRARGGTCLAGARRDRRYLSSISRRPPLGDRA